MKRLRILGTRGIPAEHGGFETFAEHLALYLSERGWQVTVYCQDDGNGTIQEDTWRGVRLVRIPVSGAGAKATVIFDWKSIRHASTEGGLILTLGYNTALFCARYRLKGLRNIMNMDGIEWRRAKWTWAERAWLYLNERMGCRLANHLVADHPEIANHLSTRVSRHKITMIPYGAESVSSANPTLLTLYDLTPDSYLLVIARPEPENSILETVTAFSARNRGLRLVVLGNFEKADAHYRDSVIRAASSEVLFPGAIYDKSAVQALRFHARLYIHGHQVGGTNPSLVEALGAGSAVLAHDNPFNRWVAGDQAAYFKDVDTCKLQLDQLLENDTQIREMRMHSRQRFMEQFTWPAILGAYEHLLENAET